jgi:hypothetical protein
MSDNSLENIRFLKKNTQQTPPAHQSAIRATIVKSRINCAKIIMGLHNFTDITHQFTFSDKSHIIGAFGLILRRVICPQNTDYYELIIESVKRGPPLEVLSFFTGPSFKDPTAGDLMFVVSLKEITYIMSKPKLSFEPDVFLEIARAIVPQKYAVFHHYEQYFGEDDEQMPRLLNPFSVPVDIFSLPARPEKRARSCLPTIENFFREPAVEVVEEEKQRIKKKRE